MIEEERQYLKEKSGSINKTLRKSKNLIYKSISLVVLNVILFLSLGRFSLGQVLDASSFQSLNQFLVDNHAPQLLAQAVNLTGQWECNDGGTYFIRQIGNEFWWYGRSRDTGATWSNVFSGTIQNNQIIGRWADVPQGSILSGGQMTLTIVSPNELRAVSRTGGFGGSFWFRGGTPVPIDVSFPQFLGIDSTLNQEVATSNALSNALQYLRTQFPNDELYQLAYPEDLDYELVSTGVGRLTNNSPVRWVVVALKEIYFCYSGPPVSGLAHECLASSTYVRNPRVVLDRRRRR
jgi:hypothetical protein